MSDHCQDHQEYKPGCRACDRERHAAVRSSLAQAPGSALAWPNIGNDPLKVGDMELITAVQRMRTACDLQQAGVPDQTALVWRMDISRVLSELTLMTARWNLHKQNHS